MRKKVLIALSGGVDSAVSASLLTEQYDCQAAFMITHDAAESALADAQAIADKLAIKLHILDWRKRFEMVLEYFTSQYLIGRTPNPCVFCNRNIKFKGLYEFANSLSLTHLATGHYCKIVTHHGKSYLYKSENIAKDQSYALAMIDYDILEHLIFPVGDKSKDDIRLIAAELGLGIEDKPDSQEICFIPDNNYASVLEDRQPSIAREGDVVNTSGEKLGSHNGIYNFTIGQRKGLGIALGKPAYVVSLNAHRNEVVLGNKEDLTSRHLTASGVNWLGDIPQSPFSANVKIRYNHKGSPATVSIVDKDRVSVEFEKPVSAITPGQAVVFYVDDEFGSKLIGGAWIDERY